MSDLSGLLSSFRQTTVTERGNGAYFEELVVAYLRTEPTYQDLYSDVWTYADWVKGQSRDARDTGIDLLADPEVGPWESPGHCTLPLVSG